MTRRAKKRRTKRRVKAFHNPDRLPGSFGNRQGSSAALVTMVCRKCKFHTVEAPADVKSVQCWRCTMGLAQEAL